MDNSLPARRLLGHLPVFRPLIHDPSRSVPIRLLSRESGTPYATTWRVIQEAAGLGVVRLSKRGSSVQVTLNPRSPLLAVLRDVDRMPLDPFLDAARRFTRRARRVPGVQRIVLFGSAGRGEAGPGSDVDVAVVLRNPRPGAVDRLRFLAADVSDEVGIPVVPVATTDERVSRSDQFSDAIRTGRELHARGRGGRGVARGR